jgi:hypothetical protein
MTQVMRQMMSLSLMMVMRTTTISVARPIQLVRKTFAANFLPNLLTTGRRSTQHYHYRRPSIQWLRRVQQS